MCGIHSREEFSVFARDPSATPKLKNMLLQGCCPKGLHFFPQGVCALCFKNTTHTRRQMRYLKNEMWASKLKILSFIWNFVEAVGEFAQCKHFNTHLNSRIMLSFLFHLIIKQQ